MERICDSVAATLLLPDNEIGDFAKSPDVWNPQAISSFAKFAGASDTALILRLEPFMGHGGCAVIEINRQAYNMKYLSVGPSLGSNFVKIDKSSLALKILDALFANSECALTKGKKNRLECILPDIKSGSKPSVWDCSMYNSQGSRWVITFRLLQ